MAEGWYVGLANDEGMTTAGAKGPFPTERAALTEMLRLAAVEAQAAIDAYHAVAQRIETCAPEEFRAARVRYIAAVDALCGASNAIQPERAAA